MTTSTPKKSRLRRFARRGIAAVAILIVALWIGIHFIPWLGPALADGVRAVLGPGPVAWAEDTAYGIEDWANRILYKDSKPKTLWDDVPTDAPAPPTAPSTAPVASSSGAPAVAAPPSDFPPPAFKPPFDSVATEGEGVWIPMKDPSGGPPTMWKAMVHPDPKRSFAVVAVVAMDPTRLDLTLVAGTQEPESITVQKEHRPGLIPSDKLPILVAAFNGGFKATHGHYGMMLGGETFLAPRDIACTVALYKDRAIKIGTWSNIKDSEGDMVAYRQTPPCLVENGKPNVGLSVEYNKNWGATVSGETVIRRSAIGVAPGGKAIFYALGDAVTAQSLGEAMKAIGAESAAQLDVNYSYPRFLLYDKPAAGEAPRATTALIKDIKYQASEYVTDPAVRDFFYVTRRAAPP